MKSIIEYASLGDVIRTIRTEHHYTQAELAKELGLTAGQISLVEQDKSSLGFESLAKLADRFNLSFESLTKLKIREYKTESDLSYFKYSDMIAAISKNRRSFAEEYSNNIDHIFPVKSDETVFVDNDNCYFSGSEQDLYIKLKNRDQLDFNQTYKLIKELETNNYVSANRIIKLIRNLIKNDNDDFNYLLKCLFKLNTEEIKTITPYIIFVIEHTNELITYQSNNNILKNHGLKYLKDILIEVNSLNEDKMKVIDKVIRLDNKDIDKLDTIIEHIL